jgi:hypothetical protein
MGKTVSPQAPQQASKGYPIIQKNETTKHTIEELKLSVVVEEIKLDWLADIVYEVASIVTISKGRLIAPQNVHPRPINIPKTPSEIIISIIIHKNVFQQGSSWSR